MENEKQNEENKKQNEQVFTASIKSAVAPSARQLIDSFGKFSDILTDVTEQAKKHLNGLSDRVIDLAEESHMNKKNLSDLNFKMAIASALIDEARRTLISALETVDEIV